MGFAVEIEGEGIHPPIAAEGACYLCAGPSDNPILYLQQRIHLSAQQRRF